MEGRTPPDPNLEQLVDLFRRHGGTPEPYLHDHFERLVTTRRLLRERRQSVRGNELLDVGAHWLHLSLLLALDGFNVTALDLPATLELPQVQAVARQHGIRLLVNGSLERPAALAAISDDVFDVVVMTEVIEHLAFNPVAMWRELYRVMRPGARLVLTTPNYYALRASAWRLMASARRRGAGVDVGEILSVPTLGHHWKEYSVCELVRYFALLSPDFVVSRIAYTEEYHPRFHARRSSLLRWLEHAVPPLRPDLYLEIDLPQKRKGIVPDPHW